MSYVVDTINRSRVEDGKRAITGASMIGRMIGSAVSALMAFGIFRLAGAPTWISVLGALIYAT